MNISAAHSLRVLHQCFLQYPSPSCHCALFFCNGITALGLSVSAAYCLSRLNQLPIRVVDVHTFAFSFDDFLKIQLKFALHLDGDLEELVNPIV